MSSNAAHWQQVRALFEQLAELTPQAQAEALAHTDVTPTVRQEVERLLAADHAENTAPTLRTPTPPTAPVAHRIPPKSLAHYELLRRVGEGGMGEVFLAHDTRLGRRVALKLLAEKLTADPQWSQRFRREAQAASSLNHPNIVTIYEIGECDGTHYIATEFVEGETLRTRLGAGRLPPRDALEIAAQIAGALSATHAAGIVHRDIKPENVMLRHDGYVKILDFGVAKAMGPVLGGGTPTSDTGPGLLMGTLGYMAPEQARGEPVDARSDVFGLGVLLYEMLTGRAPFSGPTPLDVMVALLDRDAPPLALHRVRVPPRVEKLITRALKKVQADRIQTAREVHDELQACLRNLDAPAAPKPVASPAPVDVPPIRYARSGDVDIAYQVVGDAPLDLVFVMGWVSHLEYFWSEPSFASFLRRLAGFARVILFDKRGTGLSDRVPPDQLPTLEQRMEDVHAVMDAVGSQRAVLCGVSEGGPMCSLFAATYPERTIALVMIGSYARRLRGEGYPWGPTESERDAFLAEIRAHWGGPVGLEERAPSKANEPRFREWWAAYLRHGASPSAALALTRMNTEIDIRKVLPSVQVPTLVVHRTGDRCLLVEEGRFLAQNIKGAHFVELPGDDHLPFVGDQGAILAEIERFLTGMPPAPEFDRMLATVLVARLDATDSLESLTRYKTLVRKETAAFKGRAIELGDRSVLATFDGPARAIRAACALSDAARRLGIGLHTGLHTGECDAIEDRVRGVAVDIAGSVAARARAGEVLVSSTVRDLVAGAGIRFSDRGTQVQAGDLGEVRVFAVERGAAS